MPGQGGDRSKRTVLNGRYELTPLPLARGGMGEVWEGRDTKLDREIAVKFIRFPDGTPDDELVRRFVRESRITARLQHPGVPAVFDVGTHEGRPFLVMQRIHGMSVADLVAERGALSVGWCASIAAQTCAVLIVAHQASLVHRDLKPANLMLEPDGTVKVLDFGLAVALDMADASQITRSGQTIGTPAYMAPEQVLAAMSGPRSDLYTLGCTLFEMLTGQQVFGGSTAYAVMNKQVDEHPPAVTSSRPDTPRALAQLVGELLEKKPEDRPADARSVYERLLPFVRDLGPIPGALTPPAVPSPLRMYASVVSRTFDTTIATGSSTTPAAPVPTPAERPPASRPDVGQARREAGSLVKQSRYAQAAQVLEGAVHASLATSDPTGEGVFALRLEWANVLFEGGEYRRAAPAYRDLARDFTKKDGPDSELVFRCRLQEATCLALIGDTSLAVRSLESLLSDEQRVYGADDSRPLELRRQIGLLHLAGGQRDEATRTLSRLLDDLIRVHGPTHPSVPKVRDLLSGIPQEGGR
ncbi:protein kinase domain-containing protein [Amycolatopsis jiangsuensis]|nr:serine/threonine-protein kinase [Amycolatopsis jiangsuensis]